LKQEDPDFVPPKHAAPGAKPLEKRPRDAEDADADTRARKKERRANEDEQMDIEDDANEESKFLKKLDAFSSKCLTGVRYRQHAYNGW
jgi:hypothetical protein